MSIAEARCGKPKKHDASGGGSGGGAGNVAIERRVHKEALFFWAVQFR